MDREILFRGKRQSDGVWEYGFYYAKPIQEKHFILLGENQWLVKKESVSQFTGLYDKNGTKISEGDILHFWSEYTESYLGKCVVRYGKFNCSCCDGVFGWYLEGGDIRDLEGNSIIKYEICGNIHDNPELLEGGVEECG